MPNPAPTTAPIAGARARARAEVRAAILDAASKRLAQDGATDLSLRAVARDVGMVSSAVYRYFASRDELLTALIIEAYDSLGDHTEANVASSAGRPDATRWIDAALAIRSWALAHPNDYALIYGTPIPGYAAPDDTVASGTRVSRALVRIVREADRLQPVPPQPIESSLSESFTALRTELELDVDDAIDPGDHHRMVAAVRTVDVRVVRSDPQLRQRRRGALPGRRRVDGRIDRPARRLTGRDQTGRFTSDRSRRGAGRPCASGSPRSPR